MSTVRPDKFDATFGSLLQLLGQHYGDRSVYLREPRDHLLLQDAMRRGLVSSSGRLTSRGYALWQRHEYDAITI
ncbi:MAG TPA: hypothetical protein VGB36_14310 [Gammaproteobacteria bacterium]|jgi:hypothetical protein